MSCKLFIDFVQLLYTNSKLLTLLAVFSLFWANNAPDFACSRLLNARFSFTILWLISWILFEYSLYFWFFTSSKNSLFWINFIWAIAAWNSCLSASSCESDKGDDSDKDNDNSALLFLFIADSSNKISSNCCWYWFLSWEDSWW